MRSSKFIHIVANGFPRVCRKGGPLDIVDGNVSWYSLWEKSMEVLKKSNIELPYVLVVPLVGIYLKEL
jgi:hypothetical protein